MGMDGKRTKLKAADINKVDVVPDGAQQGSRISLFKSAEGDQEKGIFAKIAEAIAKALSGFQITQVENEEAEDFNSEMAEQKVENAMCEMWDYTHALREAIKSILCSKESDKPGLVRGSLDQFATAIEAAVPNWMNGEKVEKAGRKISKERMDKLRTMCKSLSDLIADAEAAEKQDNTDSQVAKAADDNKPDKADNGEGSDGTMAENKITKAVLETLPKDAQDYIASLEAEVAKAAPKKPEDGSNEDILKGLPEGVAKMIKDTQEELKKSQTANAELAKSVAKMVDESITKDYVAKASSFDNLGIKPEEFGPVLKSIASVSPEAFAKVEAVLKAANEAIAKGSLFSEFGADGDNGAAVTREDAWGQITTLADARVTKGENATQAQAIEAVLKTAEGRKLYAIYNSNM
jgi:hypothetical protein